MKPADPNLYKSVKVAAAPLAHAKVYSATSGVRIQHIMSEALWAYLRAKKAC